MIGFLSPHPLFPSRSRSKRTTQPHHVPHCSIGERPLKPDLSNVYNVDVELTCGNTAHGLTWHAGNGDFFTCFHVIARAQTLSISGHPAQIARVCRAADIAVLSCNDLADILALSMSSEPTLLHPARYASGVELPALHLTPDPHSLRPGMSGAPLRAPSGVVGMFAAASNDGAHAIPSALLSRVLAARSAHSVRLGALPGLRTQSLALPLVRRAACVPPDVTGDRVGAGGASHGLRIGDVIEAVDSVPVTERNPLRMLLAQKTPGNLAEVTIWRPGAGRVRDHVRVADAACTVAAAGWSHSRLVVAGEFVFMALSFEMLAAWGPRWFETCPRELLEAAMDVPMVDERGRADQAVALVVVPEGYEAFAYRIVARCNDRPVRRLLDLVRFCEGDETYITLRGGDVLAVGRCCVEEADIAPVGDDAG